MSGFDDILPHRSFTNARLREAEASEKGDYVVAIFSADEPEMAERDGILDLRCRGMLAIDPEEGDLLTFSIDPAYTQHFANLAEAEAFLKQHDVLFSKFWQRPEMEVWIEENQPEWWGDTCDWDSVGLVILGIYQFREDGIARGVDTRALGSNEWTIRVPLRVEIPDLD